MSGRLAHFNACLVVVAIIFVLLLPTLAAGVTQPVLQLADDVRPPAVLPEVSDSSCGECAAGRPSDDVIASTPIERLPDRLWAMAADMPRHDVPRPDGIAGYERLAEADMRQAWQIWMVALSARAADPLASLGSGLPLGMEAGAASESAPETPGLETPRGLANLWRVEGHGTPREVLPADDAGATFLVTSVGVLRFDSPGAPPAWMFKPGGYVSNVQTTDVDGDGNLDVVLGTVTFNPEDDSSVTVLNGLDGSLIHRGFGGGDYLVTWTLTDLDGDGVDEIVGLDRQRQASGFELDGTRIYGVPILEVPSLPPVGAVVAFAWALFYPDVSQTFGDINGDGVQDMVVSSQLLVFVYGLLLFATPSDSFVSAYSGTDGSTIWDRPMTPSSGSSYAFLRGTGDFDGDGRDDVLVHTLSFGSLLVTSVSEGHEILSGDNGLLLARDRGDVVCVTFCATVAPLSSRITPIGFLDLDRDGTEELLALELGFAGDEISSLDVVARGAPALGTLPSVELYRHGLEVPGVDLVNGVFRLRDVDADGDVDLMVYVVGFQTDGEGNVTDVTTTVWGITEAGPGTFSTPGLFALYDVNAVTGQAFAWTLPDDRWVPVDEGGERIGRGLRIVPSSWPAWTRDETGDGVPDLLLRKTVGFMWVDGRTGAFLGDVERPVTRYAEALVMDEGRLRVLERTYESRSLTLVDLKTGQDVWAFDESWAGRAYLTALTDVTGDGRQDLALTWWDFDEKGFQEEMRVFDMYRDERVITLDTSDSYPIAFGDVVTTRSGEELLVVHRDQDTYVNEMRVYVPGTEAPLWTYDLGADGDFASLADGFVIVRVYGEGLTVEIVDGNIGSLLSAHAVAANILSTATMLEDLDGDGRPEAIVSYRESDDAGGLPDQNVAIYQAGLDEPLARFSLGTPVVHQVPIGDDIYRYTRYSSVQAAMGDWDGDGIVDLAFTEGATPTVRSTADGRLLAVAPVRGSVAWTPDMNDDGIMELGVLTDQSTLRLFSSASVDVVLEPETAAQLVTDPEALQAGSDVDFFDKETSFLPAPGPALLALTIVALANVFRRRR